MEACAIGFTKKKSHGFFRDPQKNRDHEDKHEKTFGHFSETAGICPCVAYILRQHICRRETDADRAECPDEVSEETIMDIPSLTDQELLENIDKNIVKKYDSCELKII